MYFVFRSCVYQQQKCTTMSYCVKEVHFGSTVGVTAESIRRVVHNNSIMQIRYSLNCPR